MSHINVVDIINDAHYDKYRIAADAALDGKYVWGINYDKEIAYRTWLNGTVDENGKRWITRYNIHYGGRLHTYKGYKGWLRTINRLTHYTREVYQSNTDYLGTAECIYPMEGIE